MIIPVGLDFQEIPTYLVTELNFPSVFVAGLFATMLMICIVMIPFVMKGMGSLGLLIGGMTVFLAVGIGWLDGWIVIVQIMFIVGLFTFGIMKKVR